MANDSVFMARRDKPAKEKASVPKKQFVSEIVKLLDEIQQGMFERALAFRESHTHAIDTKEAFYEFFSQDSGGGFASTHYNGDPELEGQIKNDLQVTVRCVPRQANAEPGTCAFTGEPSVQRVIWGKSY